MSLDSPVAVIVATDGTPLGVSGAPLRTDPTGTTTQPISAASLPLPAGAATETTLSAINTKIPASPAQDRTAVASPSAVRLTDGTAFYKPTTPTDTQPISAASLPLPAGAATETTLSAISGKLPASVGQKAMAASFPVVLASDQSALSTTGAKSATATLSNVAASASSVTLLASNANRLGVIIVNDSTSVLYVKFGATASSTSYTYRLGINSTLSLDGALLYTGLISGIWVSATGAARVTELTA